MAPASEAKRPERTYDVRSSLDPTSDRQALTSCKTSEIECWNDGGGAASVAEYVFGAHPQGPPGEEPAI